MPRAAPPPRLIDLDAVRTRVLPNGLRLRVLREAGSPTVSYATFFQVGSRNERPGITGISHLFEHMMFNGAAKYGPKQFDRVLESRGGASNAYTSNDLTVYYEDFAADALETVMDLESDRMRSLRIDDEALEQEREVVKEERRLRTDNSVYGLMEEALEALVHQAHPYRWPVIGWMSDIERITRADCEAFFRTFYAPGNAAIYVVGDLDPEATLALLARRLRRHPGRPGAGPGGHAASPSSAASGAPRSATRPRGRRCCAAGAAAAASSPDAAALDVAQVCLGVGESSRLRRRLVHKDALATSVGVSFGWRIDPGVFSIFAELSPGVKVERVERILAEELARLAERGVAAAELKRARALLRSSVLHELGTHHGLAQALGQAEALLGDWREAGRALELYARVTPADVQRVVRQYLAPDRRNTVVAGAGAGGHEPAPGAAGGADPAGQRAAGGGGAAPRRAAGGGPAAGPRRLGARPGPALRAGAPGGRGGPARDAAAQRGRGSTPRWRRWGRSSAAASTRTPPALGLSAPLEALPRLLDVVADVAMRPSFPAARGGAAAAARGGGAGARSRRAGRAGRPGHADGRLRRPRLRPPVGGAGPRRGRASGAATWPPSTPATGARRGPRCWWSARWSPGGRWRWRRSASAAGRGRRARSWRSRRRRRRPARRW